MRDAKNDGRKAVGILREHYRGSSKPRVISLYTELTSLKMGGTESVTDYMIRAEKAAASLKRAGEEISDGLLVAMVLKGLPSDYRSFCTVVTQKDDDYSFSDFKVSLRSYEEMNVSNSESTDNVLNIKTNVKCFTCNEPGHKSFQCKFKPKANKRSNKWCGLCESKSHDYKFCRRRNNANVVTCEDPGTSNDSFVFKITTKEQGTHFVDKSQLLVDCGATVHIVSDKSKFVHFHDNFEKERHIIELADGSQSSDIVAGKGDAHFTLQDSEGAQQSIVLRDALFIPSFNQNIFSVQSAVDKGATIKFKPECAELKSVDGNIFNISKRGKLYYLNSVSNVKSRSLKDWHKIFGHCNKNDLLKLDKVVHGMNISNKDDFDCKVCLEGKMTRFRSREPDDRASKSFELVHCDLAGPMNVQSREGSRFAICFVDDFSGAVNVYFLKNKCDAAEATEKYLADIAPFGTVKRLRCDNGTEFSGSSFRNLLIKNKIKQEFSAPHSPHQNGTAERMWRTLFEMARCLLIESRLPKKMWNYAIRTAAYIRNRSICSRTEKTPYETVYLKRPNVSNMNLFGSTCFAYIENKKKLDSRSEEGVFVGYDHCSPAYLVYFPTNNQLKRVRIVKFLNEYSFDNEVDINLPIISPPTNPSAAQNFAPEVPKTVGEVGERENPEVADNLGVGIHDPSKGKSPVTKRYPERVRSKPRYYPDGVDYVSSNKVLNFSIDYCYGVNSVPVTYADAMSSPEASSWQVAMEEEMSALQRNNTYELTPLPPGRSLVGGRWVYSVKLGPNNEESFKARYVAKGYSQVADIDYEETFSPTARMTSIRTLMQVAATQNLVVHQMDVKSAYLHAEMDCEIYVEQPEGFIENEKLVCKLKKSLYGLKQSGRNWNNTLHDFLISICFKQSLTDNCVYTNFESNNCIVIIIFVDDLILAANSLDVLNNVKSMLSKRFLMKDMGILSWFLGIQFVFNDRYIELNQSNYVEKVVRKFKLDNCNPKSIPCDTSLNRDKNVDSKLLEDPKLYREIVGSLIYIMTGTRPDISYIVSVLSQNMSKPTYFHLGIAKYVLKYLKGTSEYSLKFYSCDLNLFGFCDSDWGGSEDRRSLSGYCFKLSDSSSPVSWKTKKQTTVALSSCEAEYMALTYAIQEAKYLRQLLSDLTNLNLLPVTLFVDNQGAIELAKNPVHHQRSKHIDIRYHFIRDEIQNKSVVLEYVPSAENCADIFTKPVAKAKLKLFNVCS